MTAFLGYEVEDLEITQIWSTGDYENAIECVVNLTSRMAKKLFRGIRYLRIRRDSILSMN